MHLDVLGQTYVQNGVTVAGTGVQGTPPNQLNSPFGLFVDASRTVFVADAGNNRVLRFAPGSSAGVVVAGGSKGPGANQLDSPLDVFVDAGGNLYVADAGNYRVQKFAPGSITGTTVAGGNGVGSAANQMGAVYGIYVDGAGAVYVADNYFDRIQKWVPGAIAGVVVVGGTGGSDAGHIDNPTDVVLDASGNMYVCDNGNNRVQKFAPGATTATTVAGGNGSGPASNQLNGPHGITIDAMNDIYITEPSSNRVQRWSPGALTGVTMAGGNGKGAAANQFNFPVGISLDAAGNLYVSERDNHRVQRFNLLGNSCPADVVVAATSCTARATISWTEPAGAFPDSIRIPLYLDAGQGTLSFMGMLNGHGYYKSSGLYQWRVAKEITEFLGDTSVDGHLVTITSASESNFLISLTTGTGLTPWIGLYSTGKPGSFRWVTGEPFGFTKWATGEPNNNLGSATIVAEPFVHMYDVGIWNDQRSTNLRFMAEFEKPLITYRQVSGPANGSQQSVGTYQVCYESTNTITGQKDTCCFNVTVTCPLPAVTQPVQTGSNSRAVKTTVNKPGK